MRSVCWIGFGKRVSRSVSTARRWEADGRISARRLPSGQRYFGDSDVRGAAAGLRFGFDFLEHVAARGGCEIVVANQESLSPQQELVEDLLAVVPTFSCRLDALRRYEDEFKGADLAMEGDR
ncbi:recombinase family protein [Micromonospora chersina]|uniref:recombinase family protein n=1 Tax=Micromonospora chersina TaxID=47854 RepID=UPI00371D6544